jgi:hypothetical protein
MGIKAVYVMVIIFAMMALWGTPSALNVEGIQRTIDVRTMTSAIDSLVLAESNYQTKFNQTLPIATWQDSIRDASSSIPRVKAFDISYNETTGVGRFFCFTSDAGTTPYIEKISPAIQERIGGASGYAVYISDVCGVTSNNASPPVTWANYSITVYTGV